MGVEDTDFIYIYIDIQLYKVISGKVYVHLREGIMGVYYGICSGNIRFRLELIDYILVVVSTHLKNMSSSVGMRTFPTEWKNKIHVPNHQTVHDMKGYEMKTTHV